MASKRSLKTFVTAQVVLARHLQQQLLQLVEAAQAVARDGVSQARAQHHEFVLALAFGRAHGAPHGAVQAPQLALGAGVHVAHAADDAVRLVIQIEAVRHEFFQLDFGRSLGTSAVAGDRRGVPPVVATRAPIRPTSAFAASALARRTVFPSLLLFWHALNLGRQSGPLQGHQAGGPQFHFGRFAPDDLVGQMRPQFLKFAVARAAQNAVEPPLKTPGA